MEESDYCSRCLANDRHLRPDRGHYCGQGCVRNSSFSFSLVMKIACSKFDCYTDYNKCKDCQYKVRATDTFVSCYHALDADNPKFNVAVFKDGPPQQKEQEKELPVIKTNKIFNFEVYERVILTEL